MRSQLYLAPQERDRAGACVCACTWCAGPRGNTPAVRLGKETTGLQRDYYLGILHWTPQRGVVGYDTMERQCHEYLK